MTRRSTRLAYLIYIIYIINEFIPIPYCHRFPDVIAVYIMIDTVTCDSIFRHPTLKIILIRS